MMIDFLKNIELLNVILGAGVGYLMFNLTRSYLRTRKVVKEFKKEKAELEANKCTGAHNWIEMDIMGEKTHVCRDCYWSPKHEEFVRKIFVDAELERMEFESELEKYKTQRIEELAAKYLMEPDDLKIVAEEILKIKKDFTAQHLDKKLRELLGDSFKEVRIKER